MTLRTFLFENDAVLGIETPSDYLHIKMIRFMLALISSWPRKEMGEPEPYYQTVSLNCFCLSVNCFCTMGSMCYAYLHTSELDFLEIGDLYINILMSVVCVSRVATLTFSTKYRMVVKQFLTEIHLFYYKDRSKYAMKTHKMIHLICHLFTLYLVAQMLLTSAFFNLIPMYNNYAAGKYKSGGSQNSSFEHSLDYCYPFNISTDITGYIIACVNHWFISLLCSTCFVIFDLILSIMVFHLWGHWKILMNTLNDFPRPSSNPFTLENGFVIQDEKYTKEELLQVSERLKDCIDHHREIVRFTDTMSDVFGPMLLIYYGFHQASGCLLLLECSQLTAAALVRYLPLTIILTQQLIQLSVIFELVGSESEKLKDAVYGVPWECMDCANRRVVAFFLMNVQEPVHVKALGIFNVGVTSMAAILKTSVSYFTFLRSM